MNERLLFVLLLLLSKFCKKKKSVFYVVCMVVCTVNNVHLVVEEARDGVGAPELELRWL